LWSKEKAILDLMYGKIDAQSENYADSDGVSQFFMSSVIVPPTRFRPESEGNPGQSDSDRAYLHTHSAMLTKVIQANITLSDTLLAQQKQVGDEKDAKSSNATQKWIMLQDAVNIFMDASMAQKTSEKQQQGIRQLLERKEGMFRMKMMGKRVNFGGRSVISPDPMLTTDQIGVPVFMAKKLTFPESVSAINAVKLARLVKNGSDVHPGANIVEDEVTGKQILLSHMSKEERDGIAN
jgi:DNA-directed RNA polymerase I subunit RPA1